MRCCVYTVIRVEELEGLVHAELAQIWEFVAIFPRHAVRLDCRREHVRPLRSIRPVTRR